MIFWRERYSQDCTWDGIGPLVEIKSWRYSLKWCVNFFRNIIYSFHWITNTKKDEQSCQDLQLLIKRSKCILLHKMYIANQVVCHLTQNMLLQIYLWLLISSLLLPPKFAFWFFWVLETNKLYIKTCKEEYDESIWFIIVLLVLFKH